ncbi:MAG: divalent-cation tolerance protein CutA [Pseudomonadota bacterium]
MTDLIILHIACPDRDVAERIGAALVEERLAACTHLLAPHESRYRWQGTLERESEVTLLAKTRASLAEAAAARIRTLHPYEVPAIIGTPVTFATADYAAWVRAETRDPPARP